MIAVKEAAASARLCVETRTSTSRALSMSAAASARLCVETVTSLRGIKSHLLQPPSRGCVLKSEFIKTLRAYKSAATFGWLCVETPKANILTARLPAATSARLRVETVITIKLPSLIWAAAYLSKDERR